MAWDGKHTCRKRLAFQAQRPETGRPAIAAPSAPCGDRSSAESHAQSSPCRTALIILGSGDTVLDAVQARTPEPTRVAPRRTTPVRAPRRATDRTCDPWVRL